MEAVKDYILDEDNRSRVIIISVTLAIIIAFALVATSLIAGVTTPYVEPSTNTTTTQSLSTTLPTNTTTKTLTGNLTTITIGNYTTITKEKPSVTFTPPTITQPNPETMTGYPKTVSINELMFSIDNDEYYFKGFSGHELTVAFIHSGESQVDIKQPIIGIGKISTITINLNGNYLTMYMVNINTLVVTKVVT